MSQPEGSPQFGPEDVKRAAEVTKATFDQTSGRYPADIFYAISETGLLPVVELVITEPGTDKILLTKREEDDPYYAGAWHVPGVIVTKADIDGPHGNARNNAAVRAMEELGGTQITSLVPLHPYLQQPARNSKRGGEETVFYGAYMLDDEPKLGQMFEATDLPEPIHEYHPEIVEKGPEAIALAHSTLLMV